MYMVFSVLYNGFYLILSLHLCIQSLLEKHSILQWCGLKICHTLFVYSLYYVNMFVIYSVSTVWIHCKGEFLMSSPGMVVILSLTALGNWLISWLWKSSLRSYSFPRWMKTLFYSYNTLVSMTCTEQINLTRCNLQLCSNAYTPGRIGFFGSFSESFTHG